MSAGHATSPPLGPAYVRLTEGDALPHPVASEDLQALSGSPIMPAETSESAPSDPLRPPCPSLTSSSAPYARTLQHSGRSSPQPRGVHGSAEGRTVTGAATFLASCSASSSSVPQVIVFDNTKAGLQAVDKEKTEALIKEISKNSRFYENEERKAKNRQKHIDALLVKTRHYEANVRDSPNVFRKVQREVADLEATIESHREFGHVYVHIDMDMFFAAVEMKRNPHYVSLPLGIGSVGMLSTTNYVARQYGVRAGMPGFIGLRLCPQLVIVPTDYPAYRVESQKFKAVVRTYDSSAHGLGMDEIMMCLDDYLAVQFIGAQTPDERFDKAELLVEQCRQRITEATGLTASAGIAPTPTLAKMASNYKKPNGQSSLRLFSREAVMDFLSSVAVRQVPGIGKSQESILAGLGIHTMGDIYAERHRLYCILTRKTYEFLLCSAMGVGGMYDSQEATTTDGARDDESDSEWERKSVGHERTFRQLTGRGDLRNIAYRNLRDAHKTLMEEHLLASQVVLKLKFRSFHVRQHSKTLNVYTDSIDVLQRALDELLIPVMEQFADFRLLGVRLEKLKPRAVAAGVEGAPSVPSAASEDATGQKTLRDFFKQQQVGAERRRCEMQGGHKRKRDSDLTCADDADSDIEVVVVSSESQLADADEMRSVEAVPSPVEMRKLKQNVSSALKEPGGVNQDGSIVDLSDDNTDSDDDDDVMLVE
ncbi:putative DNA polymerase kappa [Leptomonas seymouri]|uniref:DNA polymerase kappa n=1 Tax=Leptomonas seymouri TaxID=5684 RepID=A0A0N0P7I6_LEPSE|nr:putative DNA polymerase kappa [Leptomonas seymouri]|eukprot:KPI88836.1 putative DNA polymerase kappa [Leptomonas seymouri]